MYYTKIESEKVYLNVPFSFACFFTNYDVTRVENKTAEPLGINSTVQKRAQNKEKTTSGDY